MDVCPVIGRQTINIMLDYPAPKHPYTNFKITCKRKRAKNKRVLYSEDATRRN